MTETRFPYLLRMLAPLIAGALGMIATPAHALPADTCTLSGTIFTDPIDFGNVAVARDYNVPNRALFGPLFTRTLKYDCGPNSGANTSSDGNGYEIDLQGLSPAVANQDLATGIQGVGLAITAMNGAVQIGRWSGLIAADPGGIVGSGSSITYNHTEESTGTYNISFQLMKTGPSMGSGIWSVPGPFQLFIRSLTGVVGTMPPKQAIALSKGVIITPTCSVNSPMVDLPDVSMAELRPAGTPSRLQKNFQVIIACPAAGTPIASNDMTSLVALTFTDNTDPTNTGDRLTLAPVEGSAGGVKVQILIGTTPLAYGPASSAPGTAHQMALGRNVLAVANATTPVQTITIPLTARYISTYTDADPLKPGIVKALATITMSYQ